MNVTDIRAAAHDAIRIRTLINNPDTPIPADVPRVLAEHIECERIKSFLNSHNATQRSRR